jgi:hypothetical protein
MKIGIKEKSKIKMVILTKNGHANHTIFSPVKQNDKPSNIIIEGMLRRFKTKPIIQHTNVIQFYENGTLIETIKPT